MKFKKFKINYCQCVSSGTAAIKVALKALNIKPGDEVITQAFNFIATIEAILNEIKIILKKKNYHALSLSLIIKNKMKLKMFYY